MAATSGLAGHQLLPREIASYGAAHWSGRDLVEMVATALGESQGFLGAWHQNGDPFGRVLSQDCGLMQINIAASAVGTSVEASLRTASKDPKIYIPVADHNVASAFALYAEPWPAPGGVRAWEPWVAYTSGWAMFPEWWIWHQTNGEPTGPWLRTGRYVQRAIVGVANYRFRIAKDLSIKEAISSAQVLAHALGVRGEIGQNAGLVSWIIVPPEPTVPPDDGIGPRPVPNHGH